jgi:hypothetical protein
VKLTDTSESYVESKAKGMPPQFQEIGVLDADKQRSAKRAAKESYVSTCFEGEDEPAARATERGVTRTFVLSKEGDPSMPCSNGRTRIREEDFTEDTNKMR